MILTGKEIHKRLGTDIIIEPFNINQLNPNSYNLRLDDEIWVVCNNDYSEYPAGTVNLKLKQNIVKATKLNDGSYILYPNIIYLARTVEYTETFNLVPMIEGRSSIGRCGLFVHITAGFGDTGFKGYWTLELVTTYPIKIYPNMEICQIYYHTIMGEVDNYKDDAKYNNNSGVQPSMIYKEFK